MFKRPHRLKLFSPWHSIFGSSDESTCVKLPHSFSFVILKSVGEKFFSFLISFFPYLDI